MRAWCRVTQTFGSGTSSFLSAVSDPPFSAASGLSAGSSGRAAVSGEAEIASATSIAANGFISASPVSEAPQYMSPFGRKSGQTAGDDGRPAVRAVVSPAPGVGNRLEIP